MHIKNIRCIEEKLAECIKSEFDKGIENIDTEEMGKVVDMLKDAAEAEYKARISVAMEEAEKEDKEAEKYMLKHFMEEYGEDDGRRYYDNYRYKTTGRFAPKGRGSYMPRRGYVAPIEYHMTPEMYLNRDPEYYRDMDRDMGRLYYTDSGMRSNYGSNSNVNSGSRMNYAGGYNSNSSGMRDGREGRSGMSRRTYIETKEMHNDNTPESKQERMKKLDSYMNELSDDMKELIKDMSAEERTMWKQKIAKLGTLV